MPEQTTAVFGLIVAFAVAAATVFRQRRLAAADIGSFIAAFLAGCNLPAAFFLFVYAIYPDPPDVATKLRGYEKYVALAGVCLLFVALASIWALLRQAWETASSVAGIAEPQRAEPKMLPAEEAKGTVSPRQS